MLMCYDDAESRYEAFELEPRYHLLSGDGYLEEENTFPPPELPTLLPQPKNISISQNGSYSLISFHQTPIFLPRKTTSTNKRSPDDNQHQLLTISCFHSHTNAIVYHDSRKSEMITKIWSWFSYHKLLRLASASVGLTLSAPNADQQQLAFPCSIMIKSTRLLHIHKCNMSPPLSHLCFLKFLFCFVME